MVHDRSQAVVAGAHVTVMNAQTNFSQETPSAADGSYRFLALPAGNYRMTVTSAGFSQFTATDIVLSVNDQLHIDITLQVGNVQQEISVSANAVQVESESTQLGDVIDSKKMLSLPLNGRSYIDLLGLQAGVVPITSESMQQDRPVSGNLSSGNLSVNGQRETANAFLVNGGDVSEGRNLGAGLIPNIDSIEEFRLITNNFDAEYGKFSGSVMNAITKSGTNSIHGTVFEFLRNDIFDGRNYFDPSRSELRRNQFGYAVVGRSGKTGFSGSQIIKALARWLARAQVSCRYPISTSGTAPSVQVIFLTRTTIHSPVVLPEGFGLRRCRIGWDIRLTMESLTTHKVAPAVCSACFRTE